MPGMGPVDLTCLHARFSPHVSCTHVSCCLAHTCLTHTSCTHVLHTRVLHTRVLHKRVLHTRLAHTSAHARQKSAHYIPSFDCTCVTHCMYHAGRAAAYFFCSAAIKSCGDARNFRTCPDAFQREFAAYSRLLARPSSQKWGAEAEHAAFLQDSKFKSEESVRWPLGHQKWKGSWSGLYVYSVPAQKISKFRMDFSNL